MATLDLSRDIDRLRDEMDDLRKDISSFTRSARRAGRARGHDALARAEWLGDRARKQMARAEQQVVHGVEARPLVSLLAAFGIGFLLAKLLDAAR